MTSNSDKAAGYLGLRAAAHTKPNAALAGFGLGTGGVSQFKPPSAAVAPAIFLSGQSNAGNQDGTPGTTDARVSVTWSSVNQNAGVPTGPGPQALQNGGHSFEWQAATNMAIAFNSSIIVAKYWGDGTMISQWAPAAVTLWAGLATALEAFALRCVAAGVSQVDFGWCQGESNTPNNQTGPLATFESDTSDLFDSVKYLLEGFGLSVHFTIIKTNAGLTTGLNPGDTSAASLATIRTAQDHLASTRTDTSTIEPPSQSAIHYVSGGTNVVGAQWATANAARYTGAQPAFSTPPTVETIMGAAVLWDWDSRSITGLNNGDPIDTQPDLGPGAHHGTQTGTARPTYRTAAFGSMPEVDADGVDDKLQVPGVSLPALGTTPFWSVWVGRQKTWTLNDRIWGGTANFFGITQTDLTPKISPSAASSVLGTNLALNTFGKIENYFSNSASDYQQIVENRLTTGALGNLTPGSVAEFQMNNTGFANVGRLKWIACNRAPTKVERDKLRGYGSRNYGLAVWGCL